MAAFLGKFFGKALTVALPIILDWLKTQAIKLIAKIRSKLADRAKNKEAREKLEKAETPEQIDEAGKDVASKF